MVSTLNAPAHTAVHNIPLGRRIREIMEEKGDAYTGVALAIRMNRSKSTVYRMLNDERILFQYELEQLSNELGVTVDRIVQDDVRLLLEELEVLLAATFELEQGKELGEKFLSLAIGVTERCQANIYLGKVYFQSQRYEVAHTYRLEAHRLAAEIKELYKDSSYFDQTTIDLITSYTVRKDYANAYVLLDSAKKALTDDPKQLGAIYYSLAMIAFDANRREEAREQLYQSLEYFKKTKDKREIGQAFHNVAYIEFELKNYEKAKMYFERAIETLDEFPEIQMISIKDNARLLNKTGHRNEAIELIEHALSKKKSLNLRPDLHAKLLILHSLYKDQANSASKVFELENVSDIFKLNACQFLMDYYSRKDDSVSLMQYYKSADRYILNKAGKLEEGCL